MSNAWRDDQIDRICVSGTWRVADLKNLQAAAAARIDAGEELRILVQLESFQGWERNDAWGEDLDFHSRYGSRIAKMAIVGEEGWREEILSFLGKGFRATAIEYFPPGSAKEAENWLLAP